MLVKQIWLFLFVSSSVFAAKVVPLAPSVADMLMDLHFDPKNIVGVSQAVADSGLVPDVPSVGPYTRLNIEKILSLRPDLAIATKAGNSQRQIKQLARQGLKVLVLETPTVEDIGGAYLKMGQALGGDYPARARRIEKEIKSILGQPSTLPSKPSVLIQVGVDPLVVAGGGSFLDSAVRAIGGRNVYSDANIRYPRPSLEDVYQKNPDFIFAFVMNKNKEQEVRRFWNSHSKRVFVISDDAFLRPSLKMLKKLSSLKAILDDQ